MFGKKSLFKTNIIENKTPLIVSFFLPVAEVRLQVLLVVITNGRLNCFYHGLILSWRVGIISN